MNNENHQHILWNGIMVEHFTVPANQPFFTKDSRYHRIAINTGGPVLLEWKMSTGIKKKMYDKGDMSIIPPGSCVETRFRHSLNGFAMSIDTAWMQETMEIPALTWEKKRGVHDPFIIGIARAFADEIKKGGCPGKLYGDSLAISLTAYMAEQYGHMPVNKLAKGKLSSYQLQRVIDYCHASIFEDISVQDLARQAHLSPFYFSRLFKRSVGMSPYQFVLKMKIENAQALLKQPGLSPKEIASSLGFTDDAHFHHVFKRLTGATPHEFATGMHRALNIG
ncbi:helix-turn-helix transcriptional regulator [Longitalea arenae]|uniref:helix-turn-helix transcriptional regulator n=1 Tax=Longitalea arenae TaxID=2812558 RepID=UPI001F081ABA|nr:AraC family transcriptional regulator [Longitalea arenae]